MRTVREQRTAKGFVTLPRNVTRHLDIPGIGEAVGEPPFEFATLDERSHATGREDDEPQEGGGALQLPASCFGTRPTKGHALLFRIPKKSPKGVSEKNFRRKKLEP